MEENKKLFKEKIEDIMKRYNMNASKFCAETGINISSLSQITSGRNMPSLKILQNIKARFPEIDSNWLFVDNEAAMPEILVAKEPSLFDLQVATALKSTVQAREFEPKKADENPPAQPTAALEKPNTVQNVIQVVEKLPRKIKRITVYFDDNFCQDFFTE
jgi:transcriptional regulator with XRE-family HTH domain